MKMEAAARVIQASWKYYQVRQKYNHQKPLILSHHKKVNIRTILDAKDISSRHLIVFHHLYTIVVQVQCQ